MTFQIEPRHDLSANEVDAIEDRLYDHNSYATGRHDGQGLGFVIRDEAGQMIGVAAGYTWAGTSELKQMWIAKAYRGRGYSRALLNAFVAEACSRGVRRIWVSSYDFQAPGMYEKAGFRRMAEFEGWPEGHTNVVLCKTLSSRGKLSRQYKHTGAEARCHRRGSISPQSGAARSTKPPSAKRLSADYPRSCASTISGCAADQESSEVRRMRSNPLRPAG